MAHEIAVIRAVSGRVRILVQKTERRAARKIRRAGTEFRDDFRKVHMQQSPAAVALRTLALAAALVEAVRLVRAAPHDDARMIAQTLQSRFAFEHAFLMKFREKIRNFASAEHEVLPDHDSVFIAEIVEQSLLVTAAAPDAQIVYAGVRRERNQLTDQSVRDASGNDVGRNPVAAFCENALAVDAEAENLLMLRNNFLLDFHRAERKTEFLRQRAALRRDRQFRIIQRLCAVTERKPVFRRGHGGFYFVIPDAVAENNFFALFRNDCAVSPDGQRAVRVGNIAQNRIELEGEVDCAFVGRPEIRVADAREIIAFQTAAAPDSADGEPLRPVPAVCVFRLASGAAFRADFRFADRIRPAGQRAGDERNIRFRRVEGGEADLQMVFPVLQKLRNIEAAGTVHGLVLARERSVDEDFRNICKSVKDQFKFFSGSGRRGEVAVPAPCVISDPAAFLEIHSDIGIRDYACPHQIQMNIAGNPRGEFPSVVADKTPIAV